MKTVALIGDSHTQVTFPMIRDEIEKTGKYKVVQQESKAGWGVKKFISDGVVNRLQRSNPDLVIFSLGGNNHDLKQNSYQNVISQILSPTGGRFLWVSPTTSIRSDVENRHAWTDSFLQSLIPSRKYISIRPESSIGHRSDNVHYTRSQYRIIADKVAQEIIRKDRSNGFISLAIPVLLLAWWIRNRK